MARPTVVRLFRFALRKPRSRTFSNPYWAASERLETLHRVLLSPAAAQLYEAERAYGLAV